MAQRAGMLQAVDSSRNSLQCREMRHRSERAIRRPFRGPSDCPCELWTSLLAASAGATQAVVVQGKSLPCSKTRHCGDAGGWRASGLDATVRHGGQTSFRPGSCSQCPPVVHRAARLSTASVDKSVGCPGKDAASACRGRELLAVLRNEAGPASCGAPGAGSPRCRGRPSGNPQRHSGPSGARWTRALGCVWRLGCAQTIRMPRLGRPSMWQSMTSPFTTGPTFSGVPL